MRGLDAEEERVMREALVEGGTTRLSDALARQLKADGRARTGWDRRTGERAIALTHLGRLALRVSVDAVARVKGAV